MTRDLILVALGVALGSVVGYHVGRVRESCRWVRRELGFFYRTPRCADYAAMTERSVN